MTGETRQFESLRDDVPDVQSPREAPASEKKSEPFFILYLNGPTYLEEMRRLSLWVEKLLIPVYGEEVTSGAPWCPRWHEHTEAVAYFHGLWLAWQDKTGPKASLTGPSEWHRDHLGPTMTALRNPSGPFAGCKPGAHRAKERPSVEPAGPENFGP
ncbi:DUF4913 domain-containing protein [Micromonospora sp. CA-248212]|uniref:DUF4913 domain-containing protein n=1 Tax=Micromonospora sp. CA-248212 TaxID=3239961 RepID=UPI003D8BAA5D